MDEMDRRSCIQDPIYGTMNFDYLTDDLQGKKLKSLVNSIVNTSAFQRLQHIDQMGMVSAVYPTALHTRYAHSLGTAHLCLMVLDKLDRLYLKNEKEDVIYRKLIGDEAKKYAFVAALLHDIGHGPFSHAFESLIGKDKKGKKFISHEDWTEYFLRDKDGDKSFFDILDNHGLKRDLLTQFIRGKYDKPKEGDDDFGVVADLISSQLDVDRMDYLLRDSYFTGIAGCKIDLDWILNHLVVFDKKALEDYKQHRARLGVSVKAAKSIAHMLLTRRRVFSAICYHKKVSLLECLLVEFLEAVMIELETKEDQVSHVSPGLNTSDLGRFLKLCLRFKLLDENDKTGLGKQSFMREAYPYYKSLTDYDVWMVIRDYAKSGKGDSIGDLAKCIYSRNLHKAFSVEIKSSMSHVVDPNVEAVRRVVKNLREENCFSWDWKIQLIESDIKLYEEQQLDPVRKEVFVKNGSGRPTKLEEVSPIIACSRDIHSKQCYVMVHPSLVDDNKQFPKIKEAFKGCDVDFPE